MKGGTEMNNQPNIVKVVKRLYSDCVSNHRWIRLLHPPFTSFHQQAKQQFIVAHIHRRSVDSNLEKSCYVRLNFSGVFQIIHSLTYTIKNYSWFNK